MKYSIKSNLQASYKRLLEEMQSVNFGRIEDLHIIKGQPQFEPRPRIIREIKFGGENGPRPEIQSDNFELKAQHREFFACLDKLDHAVIHSLEVKHGLPFMMRVEESAN